MGRRIQDQDVASPDGQFNAGDEEDALPLGVRKKVLTESHLVMIGNRNHVKPLVGRFRDQLFSRIPDPIERVFRRVKVQICFKGFLFFHFHAES